MESKGYALILLASKEAQEVFKHHWLKHWLKTYCYLVNTSTTDLGRHMVVSALFADIETITEDMDQYEEG